MQSHRFQFERPGSQHTCPGCNKKKEFTRYIDTETGELLPDYVGVCNNKRKCGYRYDLKQFLKDNPDYLKNNSFTRNEAQWRPAYSPPKNISYFPKSLMETSLLKARENTLVKYLSSIFPPALVTCLIDRYKIGTASLPWKDSVIFWQIDKAGNVRSGKIMLFDPVTGKRIKEPFNHFYWAHTHLKKADTADNFNLRQCFFGEHLISTSNRIAVVESEKTAIIASVYFQEYKWIACGGVNGLTKEKCKALEGKTVSLFPDKGYFNEWHQIGKELNFRTSQYVETLPIEDGGDLADYLPKYVNVPTQTTEAAQHDMAGSLIHRDKGFPTTWI